MEYKVVVTRDAEEDLVIIDNIFHELQDYENKMY